MYSFGGLRREGRRGRRDSCRPASPRRSCSSACVGPDLDSTTAHGVPQGAEGAVPLPPLRRGPLLLQEGPERHAARGAGGGCGGPRREAGSASGSRRCWRRDWPGTATAIVWPEKPADIPDKEPASSLAYLPAGVRPRSRRPTQSTGQGVLREVRRQAAAVSKRPGAGDPVRPTRLRCSGGRCAI